MTHFKSSLFKILLIVCIVLTGTIVISQSVFPKEAPAISAQQLTPKQRLAQVALMETGIANIYNLHLGNALDMGMSPGGFGNPKLVSWLHAILIKEAGWKSVEDQYITEVANRFSETELKELITMAKQPVIKKLLGAETQAYTNSANKRRQLFFQVWDDYNTSTINPPPDIFQ